MSYRPYCSALRTEPLSALWCFSEKGRLHAGLCKKEKDPKIMGCLCHLLTMGKSSAEVQYPALGSLF